MIYGRDAYVRSPNTSLAPEVAKFIELLYGQMLLVLENAVLAQFD